MLSFLLVLITIRASCVFELGNAIFDFSELIGNDIAYKIGEGSSYYLVSVCSDIKDPCINGPGTAAAMAAPPQFGSLYVYQNDNLCRLLGKWTPMDMMVGPLDPHVAGSAEYGYGVTLYFNNGPPCGQDKTKIRYNMLCDTGSDTGEVTVYQESSCAFVINWPTKLACAYVGPGFGPKVIHAVTLPPRFPTSPSEIADVGFMGNFVGNATCTSPDIDCYENVQNMPAQLECTSCTNCAIVLFAGGKFHAANIQADICKGDVLAGPLKSKHGLEGYIYLHSYSDGEQVKGTLDIFPYMSSSWDLVMDTMSSSTQKKLQLSNQHRYTRYLRN